MKLLSYHILRSSLLTTLCFTKKIITKVYWRLRQKKRLVFIVWKTTLCDFAHPRCRASRDDNVWLYLLDLRSAVELGRQRHVSSTHTKLVLTIKFSYRSVTHAYSSLLRQEPLLDDDVYDVLIKSPKGRQAACMHVCVCVHPSSYDCTLNWKVLSILLNLDMQAACSSTHFCFLKLLEIPIDGMASRPRKKCSLISLPCPWLS